MEEEASKIKRFFRKFWHLLWKDNSFKGWLFSVIFLFVFIKLIFFPFLGLVTGTSLPLAIVESCSMYHPESIFPNSDVWWQNHGSKYSPFIINELDFQKFFFNHGFDKGDILFIIKATPSNLKVGDIIIFNANEQNPIIHRIVSIARDENGNYLFSTMGDNNNGQLGVEKSISPNQLVGKAVFKIAPFLGWAKLMFYDWMNPVSERGFCHENP